VATELGDAQESLAVRSRRWTVVGVAAALPEETAVVAAVTVKLVKRDAV